MFSVEDRVRELMKVKGFDFSQIIKDGVLYLEDDTSLNSRSFDGCYDDIIWAEWQSYDITKIVIGKDLMEFPAEMLAEQRLEKHGVVLEVEIDEKNPCFTYYDGAIFDKNMYKLIYYTGKADQNYSIPEGVLKIGDSAFENCHDLHSVAVPDTVTEIGCFAFCNCRSIQTLKIPDGVLRIEDDVFYDVPHVFYNGTANDWGADHWGAREFN